MKPVKVLYVEDEPFLGKIVKESLENRHFEVKLVADGAQVLPAFEQFKPHACVLDVMLPNRDGFSIGKDIRRLDPHVPILFLTAKNQTKDVLQGFSSGGNDFIRKPFSMEELIVRIQNLLRLALPAVPSTPDRGAFPIGRFLFYPVQQELLLGEQVQKLSHREAQLLEIFAARPNTVIARKDILDQIWGNDSLFNSRNLDVYIAHLRDYLRADNAVQIMTLKGVGYRLVTGSQIL